MRVHKPMNASPMDQRQPSMGDALPLNNEPMNEPPQNMPSVNGGNDVMRQDSPMPPAESGGSEIDGIFNQLSPDDQKAAKSYAESLLNRDEEARNEEGNNPAPPMEQQPPVQEIYHKINGKLVKEDCGTGLNNSCDDGNEGKKKTLSKKIAVRSKSPFSSPLKK